LDNNGGIYLTFAAGNSSSNGSMYLPPRFGDNDVMPVVNDPFVAQAGMRYGHLLKYNTADGNLVWRRDFQGDVSSYNMGMDMSGPVFDSQNNMIQVETLLAHQLCYHLLVQQHFGGDA
jgi:hypothetical protein